VCKWFANEHENALAKIAALDHVEPGGNRLTDATLWRTAAAAQPDAFSDKSLRTKANPMLSGRETVSRARRRRGVAATELALLLPLLLFLLLGAVDFARLFYAYTTVTNAARNGALWLSDPLASTQSPYATFQQAALADANGLNPALTTSNVTSSTTTDASGNTIIAVTVQYQFKLISSYLGFGTVNMSRQVTMRLAPQMSS
jgi:Flp pilus assembly protein TadG